MDPSPGVDVLALSDDHVRGWSQEAYGGSEGERVHQPQLNGEVVGAALKKKKKETLSSVRNNDLT